MIRTFVSSGVSYKNEYQQHYNALFKSFDSHTMPLLQQNYASALPLAFGSNAKYSIRRIGLQKVLIHAV